LSPEEAEYKIEAIPPDVRARSIKWALTLFFIITALLCVLVWYLLSDNELYASYRVEDTLNLIKRFYPESYRPGRMMSLARNSVISELDRYSGYLEPEELNRVEEEFTGSYGGIGIMVVGHSQGLMIMSVREDGPAGKAGIRTGDVIIRADSTSMKGINSYQATYYLRGPEGSKVEVVVARNDFADTLTFHLVRERLRLEHVAYAGITQNKSLYIRLLDFESGTSEDVRAALDSLYFKNRKGVRGLILDLRGNPGGLLGEAYQVANLFLEKDILIVGLKGRSRWNHADYFSTDGDITDGLPMAIIVDRGSASASEILAGALKYAGRAALIGDTTFGKGLVQEFDYFGDGSGLRLTTARYYFEGNIFLNDPRAEIKDSAAGIPPDYYFKWIEDEPFPLRLENSLLLRDYAFANRDRIVSDSGAFVILSACYNDFAAFARKNGFHFESNLTRIINSAEKDAFLEGCSKETIASIGRLLQIAREDDSAQFDRYREYIARRLYQIALEAKYGTEAAYREAILPYRPDINLAESLFAGQNTK
jgi:C-terminal peptidase prc